MHHTQCHARVGRQHVYIEVRNMQFCKVPMGSGALDMYDMQYMH